MSTSSQTTPPWSTWRTAPASSTPLTSTTLKNQHLLPRLPVPSLDLTLSKLVESCRPLAKDSNEFKEFERKVVEFGKEGGVGRTLQKRLEERREVKGMRNWIAEWWDSDAYMNYRDSVVVNVSYYYGFERLPQAPPATPNRSTEDPAYVAASIVSTALEFRGLISKGLLEPESAGKEGGELCMESYKWAFNACRVPATPADYAVKISEEDSKGQHMVIVHKNNFYAVDLKDKDGRIFGIEEFRRSFQAIYARNDPEAPGVGILTGINRDHWAESHTHLLSSSFNAATLASIQNSAFVLCLDTATPQPSLAPLASNPLSSTSEGIKEFSDRLWKAGGKSMGVGEGANRWWDKSLMWIVFKNGEAGFVGEHSCMDGTPTARMNDFISKRLITNKPSPIGSTDLTSSIVPSISPLHFELDAKSLKAIEDAKVEFKEHVGQFEVKYLRYNRYGKDGIKKMKTSPDGWTQMIFQLAYYMTHGHSCGTYEAAQVRKFQLGRTETVRICTTQTQEWTKAMLNSSESSEKKRALFRAAVKGHGVDMGSASNGMGIDRHLFGLRKLVKDGEVAELLKDPLVARSSTWNMSTSQIYIRHAPAYGWGPVVSDGYGLPYMIHPECLQFTVTCNSKMPGQKFIDNIGKAADMLMDLMESETKSTL